MKHFIVVTLVGITLVGCANTDIYSGDVYTADQAKQVQSITYGTLVSARAVKIQAGEDYNVIGAIGGAAAGGVLGHAVGGGKGNDLATAAGMIAGALAGSLIEEKANQVNALELEIRKDNGESIVVVQKAKINQFTIGQRLRLVINGGKISVSSL